ncbi:Diguanylate phosphodiesterase [Modestobacter italicus]|uniref:Diguanylate phosphodiesterase n=1 Tax=Modestobacter italicus (strain DSM 44449 / CECT 9708 / BC 501) TaxID=2732864 RepID=I4EVM3_MODI5|nr:EAL domain-containing protein [Modestobacter marinus]CCH87436.1 Diguanylate phosphodiesterase [Modestobacter marinus]
MRDQHLTRGGVLGLAVGAACSLVYAGDHLGLVGGHVAAARDAALIAIGAAAWAIGRSARSGAAPGGRSTARDEVGEEVVWECDATGRFTHASPQCLELLGYAPQERGALSLFDVAHPDEHALLADLLASGSGWRRRPFRCVTRDGTPVWLRSTAVPQVDGLGRFSGLLGASHRDWDGPPPETTATSAAVLQVLAGDAVRTAFQPIVSLVDGRLLGAEALARFTVPDDERTTQDWFADAARAGLGIDLEVHAVRRALRAATALPEDAYVAVNLSPETLLWPGLPDVLREAPVPLARIVVELTEHSAVEDYDGLAAVLQPLRDSGLRLAVDDAGAGYATFRHILRLAPDVIKLDSSLISGIDGDPARQALAGAVVAFAREVRGVVVAEGIERPAELAVVLGLGVDAGQGYLLDPPSTDERDWRRWRDWDGPARLRRGAAGLLSARS